MSGPTVEYSVNALILAAHPHACGGAFHIDIGALHAQSHQLGHIRIVGGSRIRLHRIPAPPWLTECTLSQGQECREHHRQRTQGKSSGKSLRIEEYSKPLAYCRRACDLGAPTMIPTSSSSTTTTTSNRTPHRTSK